ncbi:thioredoxin [mine drainage metagenome]|uniref:Thioredoxin n=1 Tax=mine drainage metagenome TaxID=410659 RepID=T1A8I0_9ZZZZ
MTEVFKGSVGTKARGPGPEEDPELDRIRAQLVQELKAGVARPQPVGGGSRVPDGPGVTSLNQGTVGPFLKGHPRVVLDLWAPWCGPCRALSPVVERMSVRFWPGVAFGKVNTDEEPGLAAGWGVQSIPTLLFFREGRLVDRAVGVLAPEHLEARIRRSLAPPEVPSQGS